MAVKAKPKTSASKTHTVYLRDEAFALLDRIAAARRWTKTQVVEEALKAFKE